MRARIKQHLAIQTVVACRRVHFHHDAWTDVPVEYEDEARKHSLLETDEQTETQPAPEPVKVTREKGKRR